MGAATARINMRVTEQARDVIDRAAEMQGLDRTAFVIDAAVTRARSIILEDQVLQLTAAEVAQVKQILSEDHEATPKLQRAARRLKELGL